MKYLICLLMLGLVGCSKSSLRTVELNTCQVNRLDDTSVQMSCPDGTNVIINDGIDGVDGINGITVVEICPGNQIGTNPLEVLLLQDNVFYAFYTQGQVNTSRLSELNEFTTYQTTDGRNQQFRIENSQLICL